MEAAFFRSTLLQNHDGHSNRKLEDDNIRFLDDFNNSFTV